MINATSLTDLFLNFLPFDGWSMMRGSQAALLSLAAVQAPAATVTINPTPRQTLTSFGASGAWWPNDLNHFPNSTQQDLAHFLFSQDGLYLSSYRYNMGGDGGNDAQQVTSYDQRVESFLLRNGTYDWNRDHAGVTFLQLAQHYAVPYITFFINAAPSAIADNGAACGWTFTSDKVSAFATYIQTVLSYWTSAGINIAYVSPMNEPDNDRADCGQEGMAVLPTLRSSVLKAIRQALKASPTTSSIGIIADETSRVVSQALLEDPFWLDESKAAIASIAIHNYDFPTDDELSEYHASLSLLTAGHPPPIKFTETCCSTTSGHGPAVFGAQYDPTMTNALIVARYIWQFLTLVQAQSFDWWTAVANLPCSPTVDGASCATEINNASGYNSGLVYIDPNYNTTRDYNFYYTKRAFMLKHFSYFHRPGSVRYDIPQSQLPSGVNAIASNGCNATQSSAAAAGQSCIPVWNVLFINNQTSTVNLSLAPPVQGVKVTRVVETTDSVDWADVGPLPQAGSGGLVSVVLQGRSLTTLQFA